MSCLLLQPTWWASTMHQGAFDMWGGREAEPCYVAGGGGSMKCADRKSGHDTLPSVALKAQLVNEHAADHAAGWLMSCQAPQSLNLVVRPDKSPR